MKFTDIHPDVATAAIEYGITEEDLFHKESDLLIGCKSLNQAAAINGTGMWKSLSDIYRPEKGSDLDHYPYVLQLSFAYLAHFVNKPQIVYR